MSFLGLFGAISGAASNGFVFTVKSDNAGTSLSNQFTIPKVAGETYDYTAFFDGTSEPNTSDANHTLTFPSGPGTYKILIIGTFPRIYFNNGGDKLKLTGITQFGDVGWTSDQSYAFYGCSNCISTLPDYPPNLATATQMFRASGFTGAIPEFPITLVSGSYMFYSAKFTAFPATIPATFTNTSNLFYSCTQITGAFPSIENGVTNITALFSLCSNASGTLPTIPSTVLYAPSAFNGCSSATGGLPALPSGLLTGGSMFYSCRSLTGTMYATLPSGLTSANSMFRFNSAGITGTIPTLPSSLTGNCGSMFQGASGLTGNVPVLPNGITNTAYMYFGCSGLAGTIGDQSAADGTLTSVSNMFNGCTSLTGNSEDFWNWTTPPTTTTSCYTGCTSLTDYGLIPSTYGGLGFIMTVKTDNTGTSGTDQFTIPKYAGETYNYTATFDGTSSSSTSDADHTLIFPSGAGTYTVTITGTFPGIHFNNGGDRQKLISVVQPGNEGWKRLDGAFYGCSQATAFGGVFPISPLVTSLENTWSSCVLAATLSDVSNLTNVTNLNQAWRSNPTATVFPSIATLVNVTTMWKCWRANTGMTTVPVFMTSSTALTTAYEAFISVGSGMGGTVVEVWDTANFPNLTSHNNMFNTCTGLANYADIPVGWK